MLKGTYTALITPFLPNGDFDEKGFRENIHFQIESGISGIVVLGTTAEAPTLTEEEQIRSIKIGVEMCRGKIPLWVGTGSYSTAETIKKTQKAKDLGADGALVVTPYYNKPTQEGLFCHFRELAQATSFPILVYNIQGRTGQNLATDTLRRLMDLPEIVGVKEASGNIPQIMEVIEVSRPDFSILSGDDNLTLPVIALGGHGVVSVVSNLLPQEVIELTNSALAQNFNLARELHYRLLPLFRAAFIETNPAPIKALMNHLGMKAGSVRLPLVPVSDANLNKIVSCLNATLTLQN